MRIEVTTEIAAPPAVVFDLARDLDVHTRTTHWSREKVLARTRAGLMELGDEVTFEARHFGIRQRLTARIVEMEPPARFVDQMVKGAFESMRHEHRFESIPGGTGMVDVLEFEAPLGVLGQLIARLILARYMRRFLERRNAELKRIAEEQVAQT